MTDKKNGKNDERWCHFDIGKMLANNITVCHLCPEFEVHSTTSSEAIKGAPEL